MKKFTIKAKITSTGRGSKVILIDENGEEFELEGLTRISVNASVNNLTTMDLSMFVDNVESEIEFPINNVNKKLLLKILKKKK